MEWIKYDYSKIDHAPHKRTEKVLVFYENEIEIAWVGPDENLYIDLYSGRSPIAVNMDSEIYWMYLPQPPKE
jgi:hypothetical protein